MIDANFYKARAKKVTLKEVAIASGSVIENSDKERETVTGIASMQSATDTEVCFFYDKKAKEAAAQIKAKACVTTKELRQYIPENVICLFSDDPKISYIKLCEAMYSEYKPKPGIDPSAKIAPTAKIGNDTYIGPNVVIGDNVETGGNCVIEANTVIGRGCKLGDGCRIGSNVSITYSVIGNKCRIYNGARIGQDGFGFQLIDGQHHRIPQLGRVIIGNDVEIGANACVDRGALDDTIIGDGTRIDNLVQVAHNDKIGKGCVLVAQVGIAGSCTLGNYVVLGGQVGVADHLNIGDGVQVAAQSGVMRDIEPGSVVMGSPTVPFKDYMRQVAFLQKNSKK